MTRRILITLGSTTDEERCGDCPHMDHAFWECVAFDRRVATVRRDKPLRLHECIAAEKAAEEARCRRAPHAEHSDRVLAKLRAMTPEELRRTFIDAGIFDESGNLTEPYRG